MSTPCNDDIFKRISHSILILYKLEYSRTLLRTFSNYMVHPVNRHPCTKVYAHHPLSYTVPKSCDRTVHDAYSSRTRVGPSTILTQ